MSTETRNAYKTIISQFVKKESPYAESHVGYTASYIFENGFWQKGVYAQFAEPGYTYKVFANSYRELAQKLELPVMEDVHGNVYVTP